MNAFLAGLHLTLGTAYLAQTPSPPCPQCWWWYDATRIKNPYGIAEIGWKREWDQASIDVVLRHESSVATTLDHGMNSVEVRASWYPFR